MVTHIDAITLFAALSFSLEVNAVPVLVSLDGVICIAPFGSHYRSMTVGG